MVSSTDDADATADSADSQEIEFELPGFCQLYKNGRFLRLFGTQRLPPSLDYVTGVESKDVSIDSITGVSARIYLPAAAGKEKLPVLVYFHGGAFCLENPTSPTYHRHVNILSSHGPLIAVSVDYRLAPEHPLPAAYEDSWAALRWVFSLSDPWLADRADLNRVFLAGDSAGANIVHHMALRARELPIAIKGIALVHPYFWGSEPLPSESPNQGFRSMMDKLWRFVCPSTSGPDDPKINPIGEGAPCLASLGCEKVLVAVAERDGVRQRGKAYYEKLKESGWEGESELVETADADHVFHLLNPDTEKAKEMIGILVGFFNKE